MKNSHTSRKRSVSTFDSAALLAEHAAKIDDLLSQSDESVGLLLKELDRLLQRVKAAYQNENRNAIIVGELYPAVITLHDRAIRSVSYSAAKFNPDFGAMLKALKHNIKKYRKL